MEIRVLKYFLTVAREQNITRAAESLHITQPTLSRQLSALEEELGVTLFIRGSKKITLTDEGILLKRRALEILELEEKTIEEIRKQEEIIEGTVVIGCGEVKAVERLAQICASYRRKYPKVQIKIHTETADVVRDLMNQGLIDIALFIEPVDTTDLDYVKLEERDSWVVYMRPDDELAEKEYITKEDLIGKPLILAERLNVQSEFANWFGKDYEKLNLAFISNLASNAAILAKNGVGYPVMVEGGAWYWREDVLVQRKLYPEMSSGSVIAWRRNIPYSPAIRKFIDEICDSVTS